MGRKSDDPAGGVALAIPLLLGPNAVASEAAILERFLRKALSHVPAS